ncbi:tartronate semialdehyde reductase [Ligilactobacillus acidipiscis]|uniref:Tartronate semialdehyde reductase n=1 Tax=Ligilactobacillus acidipiscis TaxID=89059 RepID=A0A0R2K282_9LACO|nr:tartronate semialdehyde reductase [Ligilactobacillus acidipiscis]
MKVGFVGLGIMGKPMAMNLLKAGYELTVFDFNQMAVAEVIAAGAKKATSGQKVAEQTDVVITMLPNSPNVSNALFADNGIAAGSRQAKL